jgi:hypothetical protein
VVAIVAGVVARFYQPSPMWLDEALTVNIAALPIGEIPEALRADGHPPLYYLVLHAWMNLVGTSTGAVRALSGILSVASLPLAWLVGRRIGGAPLGLLAAAVLAASPYAIRYGTENRMYALMGLLVLAGWLVVGDLWRGSGARWRVPLLAVITAAALLTHYWALFLVAATAAVVAWRFACAGRCWPGGADPTRRAVVRSGAQAILAALVAGGAVFALWLPSFLTQLRSTGTPWAVAPRPTAALGTALGDLVAPRVTEQLLGTAIAGVLVLLALTGRRAPGPGAVTEVVWRTVPGVRVASAVGAATLVVGIGAGLAGNTAFEPRYAMVVAPIVVVVLATGLAVVGSRVARLGLAAALFAVGAFAVGAELASPRTQAGEIAIAIAADAVPGDVVAWCPDQLGPGGDRELVAALGEGAGDLTRVVLPTLDPPGRVDWTDYGERNAAADPGEATSGIVNAAGEAGAVWFVMSPGYRTLEGFCEAVAAGLATQLGPPAEVVALDDNIFEPATLLRFSP